MSIKTAFNLVKIHLFFRIDSVKAYFFVVHVVIVFGRLNPVCFLNIDMLSVFYYFYCILLFYKKIKCKNLCSNRTILQVYTYIVIFTLCVFFASKRKGGGHDYWFTQGPLDGIEICLMYAATDVYISWYIRVVIQSESLHFYVSYNISFYL